MMHAIQKARLVNSIKSFAFEAANDQKTFDEIVLLIGDKSPKIDYNAAWIISHAVDLNPKRLKLKHYRYLLDYLENPNIAGGCKRNIMRIWQNVELPEKHVSEIANYAIEYLSSPKEDIAVKAFSITVLENCLNFIPELKEEVMFIIEKELPLAGAAISSRMKRFIKAAKKINLD